jgi:hypothetical protein
MIVNVLGEQQDELQSSRTKGQRGHALATRIRSPSPSTPAGTLLLLVMVLDLVLYFSQPMAKTQVLSSSGRSTMLWGSTTVTYGRTFLSHELHIQACLPDLHVS